MTTTAPPDNLQLFDALTYHIERINATPPELRNPTDVRALALIADVTEQVIHAAETFVSELSSPDLPQEVIMPRPRKNKGYTPPEAMPYVGTREASEILGVSVTVVKRLAKRGDIPSAYLVDNKFYIMLRSEVIELKQKRDR